MSNQTVHRKTAVGVVVSDVQDQTIVVRVERQVKHSIGKYIRRRSKFHAHDPKNECGTGDMVKIRECRPRSKLKTWELVEIVEKGSAE